MTERIRVMLVDDHPVMRRGLSEVIHDLPDMEVCGEAADATTAFDLAESLLPDAIVVDISLGESSGIELIKKLKSRFPELKIIVLSMHDESLFGERAIRAGAMGYVNKSDATDSLIDAIREAKRGRIYLSNRAVNKVLNRMANGKTGQPPDEPIETLSDREIEVFEMIGHGLTTKQIAAKLHLSVKTVETYREHIKAKLGLRNAIELTRNAVQWVLEGG